MKDLIMILYRMPRKQVMNTYANHIHEKVKNKFLHSIILE